MTECLKCGAQQAHRICQACFDKEQEVTDVGTSRWWGPTWRAPVNIPEAEIPPPLGAWCSGACSAQIMAGESGLSIPAIESEFLVTLAQAGGMVPVTYAHYHRGCFLAMLGLLSSPIFP